MVEAVRCSECGSAFVEPSVFDEYMICSRCGHVWRKDGFDDE